MALAVSLSACADSARTVPVGGTGGTQVASPGSAERSYGGPLYVAPTGAHPRAGAAAQVVDCRTWGNGGSVSTTPYAEGATTERPERALTEEGIFDGPRTGLRIAARTANRVLYVLEVHGSVKEAVIVHNGPATKGAGGPGWYVESWAACDLSEFPRSYTDSLGIQVWTDASGQPAPVTKIQSTRGPQHCDWQSMTFLTVDRTTYVRDPLPSLSGYFAGPYAAHASLPADAIDTGYRHDGDRLWLSTDEQAAYVGTTSDVEVWPREVTPLGCA